MSSYLDNTAGWSSVVETAVNELGTDVFPLWLMAVGVMGSDAERAENGRHLLETFKLYQQKRAAERQIKRGTR